MRGTCSRCGKQAKVTEYIGKEKSEWLCDKCAIAEESQKEEKKK